MRRHVHLASIGQQKAIGFAVLVDEKLVHGPGDFREVIGIDPMHVKAPCVRLSGSPADVFARRVPTGMPLFLLCFEESRDERSVVFHDTRRRECGRMGNAGLTSTRRANAALWLGNDAVRYGADEEAGSVEADQIACRAYGRLNPNSFVCPARIFQPWCAGADG